MTTMTESFPFSAAAPVFSAAAEEPDAELSAVPASFPEQPAMEHTMAAAVRAASIVFIVCFFMNLSPFCSETMCNDTLLLQARVQKNTRKKHTFCMRQPSWYCFIDSFYDLYVISL